MSYEFDGRKALSKADFTAVGGAATLTDTAEGVNFVKSASASAYLICGMYVAAPATPYTATACMSWNGYFTTNCFAGMFFSDGTKYSTVHLCSLGGDGHVQYGSYAYSTTTSFSTSNASVYSDMSVDNKVWLQIADNGTNRYYRISKDGINFFEIFSQTRTTFLTPTRIGLYIDPYSSDLNVTFNNWTIT